MKLKKMTKKQAIGFSVGALLSVVLVFIYFSTTQSFFEGNINECYQESALISTACGGLATGFYTLDNNVVDGVWTNNNDLIDHDFSYFEYTVPANTVSVEWRILPENYAVYDISIPSECIGTSVNIRGFREGYDVNWSCESTDGSWVSILELVGDAKAYVEEAIIWQIQEVVDCWNAVDGVCVNAPATTCDGFQTELLCQAELPCWILEDNACSNVPAPTCASGYATESLCVAEILPDIECWTVSGEFCVNNPAPTCNDFLTQPLCVATIPVECWEIESNVCVNNPTPICSNYLAEGLCENDLVVDCWELNNNVCENVPTNDCTAYNTLNDCENEVIYTDCWTVDNRYCVDSSVVTCNDFLTRLECEASVPCWEVDGNICENTNDPVCGNGYETQELCTPNILPSYTSGGGSGGSSSSSSVSDIYAGTTGEVIEAYNPPQKWGDDSSSFMERVKSTWVKFWDWLF